MADDDQLKLKAEHLIEGASGTSSHVRNVYITFLLLCTYIGVIIGSTTHEQLLLVDPVTLPILNVGLPIVGFYIFIPWLLVIFHFNLLLQFYFLSRVLRRADEAIDKIKQQSSQDELRDTLFPFHFSHLLAGRQHSKGLKFLLTIIVWITVMLVPLLLLVWAQVQFLPYHDEMITWIQRAALMTDFTILWILWPMTMSPQGSLRTWWWHFITATPKALWVIITGFWAGILIILKRSSISQLSAKRASVRFSHHARGAMTLLISSLILIPFSVFVAVIPDKTMESWLSEHEYLPESWIVDVPEGMTRGEWKRSSMLILTYTLFEADDAPLRRNLAIVGKVLVAGSPSDATLVALQEGNPEEQERVFQEIRGLENLAGRDLRYANFSRSYLPKVNLKSAQLQGAKLSRTQLQGAKLSGAQLQGAKLSWAKLQRAKLSDAQLQGANLTSARLQGAGLFAAQLQGANLSWAKLQGAKLSEAQLQGANLTGAKIQGAELFKAQLQGAELSEAQLQGAELSEAQLQGAKLSEAQLQGANLTGAKLQGAELFKAQLQGANLYGAQLQGAELTSAQLQGANLSWANLQGADLLMARLQGAILKDADLSLAVLFKLGRGQFTKESYDSLEKNLIKQNLDKELMRKILQDVDALIGRADDLVFGPATHHALCDEVGTDDECLTLEQEEQFVKEWVEYIVSVACPDSDIAEGVVRQVMQYPTHSLSMGKQVINTLRWHQASMLVKQLLSPDCKGGAGLPDDVREEAIRIIARVQTKG